VLLHRVANATQHVANVNALLSLPDAGRSAGTRAMDLSEAARSIDQAGWLLALCASAQGADLVLARREPAGLEALLQAVRDVVRRERRDLERAPAPLPRLAAAGDGWRAPWAIAGWLHAAALDLPAGASLGWRLEETPDAWCLACACGSGSALRARTAWLAARVPEARVGLGDAAGVLRLPRGWLAPS